MTEVAFKVIELFFDYKGADNFKYGREILHDKIFALG